MKRPRPPSTFRVIYVLSRASTRRFVNRLSSQFQRGLGRKKKSGDRAKRRGTPGKARTRSSLLAFLGLLFLFQGLFISNQFIARIGDAVRQKLAFNGVQAEVPRRVYRILRAAQDEIDDRRDELSPEELDAFVEEQTRLLTPKILRVDSKVDARKLEAFVEEFVKEKGLEEEEPEESATTDDVSAVPVEDTEIFSDAELRRAETWANVFRTHQINGFHQRERKISLVTEWPASEGEPLMLSGLGAIYVVFFLSILCTTLGSANQDLGRVEWSLEWLFTFPVKTRSLFIAKILEYSIVSVMGWFTVFPFSAAMLWSKGFGWWCLPLALFIALYFNLLVGSARVLAETWLRKRLSLSRMKNVQAVFTVLGLLLLYVVLYLAIKTNVPDWYAQTFKLPPAAILALPMASPVMLCSSDVAPWLAVASLTVVAGATLWLSAGGASRLVRTGLVAAGGPYQGTRRPPRAHRLPGLRLSGIVGKELRLLFRDRNFFVQMLVVPVLIVGFQVVINPGMIEAASENFHHAAMIAFAIGAYVLMFGGFSILNVEGPALWILYTVPQPLTDILRRKAMLWAGVSALYVTAVLAIFGGYRKLAEADVVLGGAMAFFGVMIYAFIAAGMGILGADPLQREMQRRVRPGAMNVYMIVASMYAYGIYAPELWNKIALMTLCALLAYAIWQKVRDHVPFLLDPTAAPPPRIALSDGLIAALAFFVLQGTVMLIWQVLPGNGTDPADFGPAITIAFVVAGTTVVVFSMLVFARLKVPNLLATLGLKRGSDASPSLVRTIMTGGLLGGGGAAFGILYLRGAEHVEFFRELKQASNYLQGLGAESWWWLALLAIVAAPLFEEFIFRALVYRGLRRTLPVVWSVLASAAIFAVVHPPFSVIPVFVLGILTAVSFELTGLLLAPIVVHMVYNAVIIAVS